MRTRSRRQRGVTLVEMLVVLVFTAIVLGISFRLLISVRKWWLRQETEMTVRRAGWVVAQRIAKDLRMVMPPTGPAAAAMSPSPTPAKGDVALWGEPGAIQFWTARGWPQAGVPMPGIVRYAVKHGEDGSAVGVTRTVARTSVDLHATPEATLSTYCGELHFEYMDSDGKWQADWHNASVLPHAVRVSVGALMPESEQPASTALFTTSVGLPAGSRVPR